MVGDFQVLLQPDDLCVANVRSVDEGAKEQNRKSGKDPEVK
jgi:hypothetical protein